MPTGNIEFLIIGAALCYLIRHPRMNPNVSDVATAIVAVASVVLWLVSL